PVGCQHLAPAARRLFVPERDIAAGNDVDIGHVLSPSIESRLVSADRMIGGLRRQIDYLGGQGFLLLINLQCRLHVGMKPVFTENSSSGVVVMKSAQDAK